MPQPGEAGVAYVEALLKYVQPGQKAVFHATDRSLSHWPVDERRMRIHDMRPVADTLSLERNGFVLAPGASAADLGDPEQVRSVYHPETADLVRRLTGAEKVVTFGEVVRSDRPGMEDGRLPAYGAHVDYGERTIRWFAANLLGQAEADRWLQRRFALINVWRPLRRVEKTPLALVDASTVRRDELNDSEVRGGLNDPGRPSLWGYNLAHSHAHRWWYAPRMGPDEALVFRLFDSDPARPQWTAHTAFDDPQSRPDAPPRESIEVRTLAFFPA